LEPYVLNEKLTYVAPEPMAAFVEQCKLSGDLSMVERCLLHMDVKVMDFDSVLKLLRDNKMYSALLHVYTRGLDDFETPLQILFEEIFDVADLAYAGEKKLLSSGGIMTMMGAPALTAFEQIAGKAMLFLDYSFKNKSFPKFEPLHEDRLSTLRPQLLKLIMSETYVARRGGPQPAVKTSSCCRNLSYPYLKVERGFSWRNHERIHGHDDVPCDQR
jgi:hypothetical protein